VIKGQKGFTLIELLIVIVIIGILAGVLIAIIDPAAQQNRARDAGVQAAINKVSLATQGFVSAYGRTPEGDEFINALDNSTAQAGSCLTATDTCLFAVTGNPLPVLCDPAGNGWDGAGAAQCYYWYVGALGTGGDFQIYARSFGIVTTTFQYDNTVGRMQQCDEDGLNCI